MPLGEALAEGLIRVVVEFFFEGVAYFTGYVILYPFTFGRVKEKFSSSIISLVGLVFWIAVIALIVWQPWKSGGQV